MPVITILRRLSQKDYCETWAILACRERLWRKGRVGGGGSFLNRHKFLTIIVRVKMLDLLSTWPPRAIILNSRS